MALILCDECNKQISEHAVACPHCGAPVALKSPQVKTIRAGAKWEAAGTLIIISGLFVVPSSKILACGVIFIGLCIFVVGRFL